MVLSKEDIEAAIAQSQHQDEIRHSLSNYFEDLEKPVAVAIGIGNHKTGEGRFGPEFDTGGEDRDVHPQNVDKVVRIKSTKDSSGYFVTTKSILNPKEISFRYGLKSSDASKVNKNSFVKVYYSLDNENWTLLTENKITSDKVDYKKELDINNEVYLKVEFVTEYAELTLDIDDFKVTRSINNNDVNDDFYLINFICEMNFLDDKNPIKNISKLLMINLSLFEIFKSLSILFHNLFIKISI